MTGTATRLRIDVWADVICPWCYLGEQRLATAVAASPHSERIDLRVRTFQLDPGAAEQVIPNLTYLSRKFGIPTDQAAAMERNLARLLAAEGLRFELDRPNRNTLDMLRLVKLGDGHGRGWEYLRGLQTELFAGNPEAFGADTMVRAGVTLGIPEGELHDVLAGDRFAADVAADQREAVALGVRGVPFTVLGGRLGIPGAVSVEQYAQAIDQAWDGSER